MAAGRCEMDCWWLVGICVRERDSEVEDAACVYCQQLFLV